MSALTASLVADKPSIPVRKIERCNSCGSTNIKTVSRSIDFEYKTCSNEFSFVTCNDCGLTWLHDMPEVSQLGTIYPPTYIPYQFNEHLGGFIARLRDRVQQAKVGPLSRYAKESATIVDVGCGAGEFLRLMKKHGPQSWTLIGVDMAQEAISHLSRYNIGGIVARFEELQWDKEKPAPDVIVMNQVIEHVDDPSASTAKAFELLAPGGYFFIETPSTEGWDAKLFAGRYWGGWHTPRHWHLYDEKSLRALLTRHGFEVVETSYLLSPNFWLQSVHHYLDERGWHKLADWFDVSHFIPLAFFSAVDVLQKMVRGKTSNFRMVARKPAI